jgi:hypothetical protein
MGATRRTTLIGFAALACTGSPLHAQSSPPQPAEVSPKLNLTLEQHHIIKENLKDLNKTPSDEKPPAVGDHIPPNTELQPIPTAVAQKVPQVKTHKFYIAGGQIVIVDPKANIVADLIKLGAD